MGRRSWRVAAGAALGVLTVAVIGADVAKAITGYQLDLSVFRDAGAAFVNGAPLYSDDFPSSSGFRFIYPPFAALAFVPMTWVSAWGLQVLWALLNIALVWWILRICLDRLAVGRPGRLALLTLGPALLLEPVRANFGFGQINIVLLALVVGDCLRVLPRRYRGAFIGLAAAIKLTPAGYALVLLARREWGAVVRAVAVFGVTILVGVMVRPRDSMWFWVSEFFRDDRAGGHEFSRNQAFTGVLARSGAHGSVKDAVWLVTAAVIAVAAFWAVRRFARNGEHVVALGVVALAVLLAAPFAVNHHWVPCILLLPLLIAPRYRPWRPLLALAAAAFLIGPHYLLDWADSRPPWQAVPLNIAGNAQFLAAATLFVAAVLVARRRGRPDVTVDAPPAMVVEGAR